MEREKKVELDLSSNVENAPKHRILQEGKVVKVLNEENQLINCLRNEVVNVKFIMRPHNGITDPDHILYGGMANGAKLVLTTPLLRNGSYADVLTKDEKNFLEYSLGLESNALSVYNRTNNFWSDTNTRGLGKIELKKGDNKFNLADPMDYIRFKVVLANKDIVASSVQALQDSPKATYKYVVVRDHEVNKESLNKLSTKAKAYKLFGKIEDDPYKLKLIIETIDGRTVSSNTKLEVLQSKVGELLESNTKAFINTVEDPLIDTKVLIKRAIEAGIIAVRGDFLYLKDTNTPLCGDGQNPTLSVAANYLSLPKNQELKFRIEAKLK